MIDLVASRAPNGFKKLSDAASDAELAEIARGYATLAGFATAPAPPRAKRARRRAT